MRNLELLYRKTFGKEMPANYEKTFATAIDSLHPANRRVLIDRYIAGKTLAEIAEREGVTRQCIEQREREARRMLLSRVYFGAKDRIEYLGLPKGTYESLLRAGITSIEKLDGYAKRGTLTTIKGIGETKAAYILQSLISYKERNNGNTL